VVDLSKPFQVLVLNIKSADYSKHHFDFIHVAAVWNGKVQLSHMLLVIGKDPISGTLIAMDPMVGTPQHFSYKEMGGVNLPV
jgi:hypothetical protein